MTSYLDILAKVLESTASEAEVRTLAAQMKNDPKLRSLVAQVIQLHGNLGVALAGDLKYELWSQSVMNGVTETDRELFVRKVHSKLILVKWGRRLSYMAATIFFMAVAGFLLNQVDVSTGDKQHVTTVNLAATLIRAEKFDSSEQTHSEFNAGMKFQIGDVLDIEKGLIELDLNGCGRLIVEGPTHISFPEPHRAVLKHGRVVMKATTKGHGYRIDTPMGGVIDLGTEFGVSVDSSGTVETHVLDGHVETITRNGKREILTRDEALRFDADNGLRIPVDSTGFYTQLPPINEGKPNFVHWSMDQRDGDWIDAQSRGLGGENPEMSMRNIVGGNPPELVAGVVGSSVSFDGKGAYLESGFRGIGGAKPRTVCMWVKTEMPREFAHGYGILSWGRYHADRPGEAWQISVNTYVKDGPTGRLRVGLHKGQVIGSTDLRDGKWHHIAVVLYGGSSPDVGTHVLLYVDGKLETITARALRKVQTDVENADRGVWVGRNMVTSKEGEPYGDWEYFKGNVDELYIFDAALSHAEILSIMEQNKPPE